MLSNNIEEKLTDEEIELLKEASKDKNGIIIKSRDTGGLTIQTNERNFVEMGNPKSEALWESALKGLCEKGLVEELNEGIYKVTNDGYIRADKILGK